MNWYKKIILSQEIMDSPVGYTQVGHIGINTLKEKIYEKPNFMWVHLNGDVLVEEETDEITGHGEAFGVLAWSEVYSGRYESDTGILSITTPHNPISKARSIPTFLMDKLRRAFPDMIKVYRFK